MPPTTPAAPTRQTSEFDLDKFNDTLRQQPYVQQWLTQRGKVDTGRGVQLSERERDEFTSMLRRNGVVVPSGMKVDGAGNFNQTNRLWRNIGIGAAIGGLALTGLGAAGIGPLAGALGAAGGAAGAAGAGGAGAAGATGAGTVAGLGGAGAAGLGGVSTAGLFAPTAGLVGTGAAGAGAGGALGAAGGVAGAAGTAGTLRGLLTNPEVLGAAGAGLGAWSQAQAQNRGAQFGGQYDLERLLLERDQEARVGQQDAWRKLLASQRTLSPGTQPNVSPYAVAPRQRTDVERQGAEALSASSLGRLQGGPRPLSIDPGLLEPGTLESILGYAGPALSVYGQLRTPRPPVTGGKPTRVEYYEG